MPASLLWWSLGTWYSNINSRRPLEPTKNSPQSGPRLIVTRRIYSLVTEVSENAPSWKQRERRSNYTKGEKNPDDNRTSQNMHTFSWKRTDRQTMVNENCYLASFGRCCWRVCKCWRMLAVNFASDLKKKKKKKKRKQEWLLAFCGLKKGISPKMCIVLSVSYTSVLLNLLRVWIFFQIFCLMCM